jgi:hypothetical protein
MKKISSLFPKHFSAIPLAQYVRNNNVSYIRLPEYYGGAFVAILITDERYEPETLLVAFRQLLSAY